MADSHANLERASVGHRVARVEREVHDDLVDRRRISPSKAEPLLGIDDQANAFAEHRRQQFFEVAQFASEVKWLRPKHLLTAKRQQLAREIRRAVAGLANLLDPGAHRIRRRNA